MCNFWCFSQGRGHLHTQKCRNTGNTDKCTKTEEKSGFIVQKHCNDNTKYGTLHENTGIDEILHSEYWEQNKFKDPCHDDENAIELFGKCNAYCGDSSHKENKIYCKKHVWHKDVEYDPEEECTIADGHIFPCNHPKPPHVYVHYLYWHCCAT